MGAKGTRITRLLLVLLIVLATAALASSGYQAYATDRDLEEYPALGQMIDVGGYRLQHLLYW